MIRKRPVQLAVHDLDLDGQRVEHRRDDQAAHPVCRVRDDPQRPQAVGVGEKRPDVRREIAEDVELADLPGLARCRIQLVCGERPDPIQSGLLPDRAGAGTAELDAVVGGRIVRGGEHRAGGVEVPGRVVEHVRRGQTQVDHSQTLTLHTRGERRRQLDPRGAHVPGDQHPPGSRVDLGDVARRTRRRFVGTPRHRSGRDRSRGRRTRGRWHRDRP